MKTAAACLIGLMLAAPLGAQESADVVYYNGKIVTANATFDIVQAVAVRDGKIVAVGTNEQVRRLASKDTRVADLGGKTVLPGFVDNHVHPKVGSRPTAHDPMVESRLPPTVADLRHAYTWEENKTILREYAQGLAPGAWLRAEASRLYFTDKEPPTPWFNEDISKIPNRYALDGLVPNNPVVVRASQIVVANSMALRIAGITKESTDPPDGRIVKDEKGEPTGILWYSVGDRVEALAPPPAPVTPLSRADEFKGYKKFFDDLVKLGITSLNIAGATPAMLRLYQELQNQFRGTLPRMTVQVSANPGNSLDMVQENLTRLEGYGWHTGAGDDWVKLGAVKMNLDGGYTFSRPWPINREPHKNVPTYYGGWRQAPDYFYHMMKRAHELGWQIGVHVAGDAGVMVVVDVLERILKENPRPNHRHHIIHFEVTPPEETFQQMKRLGIGVALQPNFTYTLQPFFSWALTGERLETNNPSRTILNHGLHLSYGADERPYGPLIGIFAQVTRRGVDGKVYGPKEAVTVQEAIRAYTIDSAWHTFDEKKKGSLEVGKLADMVVLAEDILSVEPLRIKDIKVLQTIIGGVVVYSADRGVTTGGIGAVFH